MRFEGQIKPHFLDHGIKISVMYIFFLYKRVYILSSLGLELGFPIQPITPLPLIQAFVANAHFLHIKEKSYISPLRFGFNGKEMRGFFFFLGGESGGF